MCSFLSVGRSVAPRAGYRVLDVESVAPEVGEIVPIDVTTGVVVDVEAPVETGAVVVTGVTPPVADPVVGLTYPGSAATAPVATSM